MKLTCCELGKCTGLVAVSVETGFSVERVKRWLVKKGVKPVSCPEYMGHHMYASRLVQEAFRDVKFDDVADGSEA